MPSKPYSSQVNTFLTPLVNGFDWDLFQPWNQGLNKFDYNLETKVINKSLSKPETNRADSIENRTFLERKIVR